MRRPLALWAVVIATAQALLGGCGGTQKTAPSPELIAPGESGAVGPGALQGEPVNVEEFAKRVDPSTIPAPSSDSPSRGPAGAPVTIHLWSDFECPFCGALVPVLREAESEFGASVRIVWHNFPLPGHPHAELAAVAGAVVYRAHGGAAFWRYHDAIFLAAPSGLDEDVIQMIAKREGVTPELIAAARSTGADGRVPADVRAGDAAGVQGTPAFLVNDWMVTGTLPYVDFRALVARALAEAQQR